MLQVSRVVGNHVIVRENRKVNFGLMCGHPGEFEMSIWEERAFCY